MLLGRRPEAPRDAITYRIEAFDSCSIREIEDFILQSVDNFDNLMMELGPWTRLAWTPSQYVGYDYMGIYRVRQGQLEAARGWLDQALRSDPGNALAITYIGEVLFRNNDRAGAADHWRRAVNVNECIAEAQAGLALSLFQEGRVDQVILHYKEAVRCDIRYYDPEYLADAKEGAAWSEARVEAVRPLLERVPAPVFR